MGNLLLVSSTQCILISWRIHFAPSMDYKVGRISVSAVQLFIKPLDPFEILDNEERCMVLYDDCHVGVGDGVHLLIVLRILHQITDMALQSISDQTALAASAGKDKRVLTASDIIMLNSHKDALSAWFRGDNRSIEFVQSVTNYAESVFLEYNMEFLPARTSIFVLDRQSIRSIEGASLSICRRYIRVTKIFLYQECFSVFSK